jgi:hypothetical protein
MAWYTAVTDAGRPTVLISGPYRFKADADIWVKHPGSRDRKIAEAVDPWAHFYRFLTVKMKPGSHKTVATDPRVQAILKRKGIAV